MSDKPGERKPELDEFGLVEKIRRATEKPAARVLLGIGDDAAICESPQTPLLLCSDAMVEGTHFRLDWSAPEDIGHKALASCLSDIAAMRGRPLYALVSLSLKPGLDANFVEGFYRGLAALGDRHDVAVVGGDLVRSTVEVFVDVMLVGTSERPATRSGARPGDLLFVSGTLGASRAGLVALENGVGRTVPALLAAHLRPEPRFDVAQALGAPGLVTAMIDISDGLASELRHLTSASKCGALVYEAAIPISEQTRSFALARGHDPLEWAWAGGEDYQLLVAMDENIWIEEAAKRPGLKRFLTPIGRMTEAADGLVRIGGDGSPQAVPDSGWNHFRR